MDYKVHVTEEAEKQLDAFLNYLVDIKKNIQAAKHLLNDFDESKELLKTVAGSLKKCDDPRLNKLGYHRMNFPTMDYFVLYRIEENVVIIDSLFHSLQDYENKMR